jgi:CRISPR/Cas system-associated exonuclease Cas4 (RecB family)
MRLPPNFLFSQGNLQDYVDCRRRFQLRHIEKLAWPAVRNEPVIEYEQAMFQGQKFHRLVNGYFLDIPVNRLVEMAEAGGILDWWTHFLELMAEIPHVKKSGAHSEVTYLDEIGTHRLIARYDLVFMDQGKIVIYDWKTSKTRPQRNHLQNRLQTRIYPYLLVERSGKMVDPRQVMMVYWFSEFPAQPEMFIYSKGQMQQDKTYLANLVSEIERIESDEFYPTPQKTKCRYCVYRSLCDRGVEAGNSREDEFVVDENIEESSENKFDFLSIPEIEF